MLRGHLVRYRRHFITKDVVGYSWRHRDYPAADGDRRIGHTTTLRDARDEIDFSIFTSADQDTLRGCRGIILGVLVSVAMTAAVIVAVWRFF